MDWVEVKEKERSAIMETTNGAYEILLNQRQCDELSNGFLLYDVEKYALIGHMGETMMGLGTYNAFGATPECAFKTTSDIKKLVDRMHTEMI